MPNGTTRMNNTGQHNRDAGSFADRPKRSPSNPRRHQADTTGVANAKRSYERYMSLARTAVSIGDAVDVENFYQHAEHYLRLMREQAA